MKINCNIADDLLPLYLDDACSEDSKAALEKHLSECASCREKLERMKAQDITVPVKKTNRDIQIAEYAKKVSRHRLRVVFCTVFLCVASACVLSLLFLTIRDVRIQANPAIYELEEGVHDLTANPIEISSADAGQYVFYTNYKQIKVEIPKGTDFDGEVLLWDVEQSSKPIRHGEIDTDTTTCVFTGLSSAQRYKITFPEDTNFLITVSEGRTVSFWNSLKNVLSEIFES